MKESATYRAILEEGLEEGRQKGRQEGLQEGQAEEARTIVLRLGGKRFGSPSAEVQAAIQAESDLTRLEALLERLLEAESWQELITPPAG